MFRELATAEPRSHKGGAWVLIFGKGGVHEIGTVIFTASAWGRRASERHMGLDCGCYKQNALNCLCNPQKLHAPADLGGARKSLGPNKQGLALFFHEC